uniref:Uncharacterized protein n=1 Tax=Rhizophagus irregularis (strain DAOM 181602 / DAOM 197198 / MUCL 43194) TaxID=747089 RepID=U9V584_RHIID
MEDAVMNVELHAIVSHAPITIHYDNRRKNQTQKSMKAFKDFENLPNLHTNFHLLLHAKNYATLLNTNAGTKEMIHRIFKNIVPRTNLKNKWVLRRNVEMPLLVNINEELKLAYEDFRDNSAIPNSMPLFFETTNLDLELSFYDLFATLKIKINLIFKYNFTTC